MEQIEKDVAELVLAHKWVAVAAILIGALVRALKADTPIPVTIPPRWRPILALGLGMLSGALQRVAEGVPWAEALVGGLVSGVVAIVGHDVVVEALRGGREFGAKRNGPPSPPVLPVLLVLGGCGPMATPQAAAAAYESELLACVERSDTIEASRACRADVDRRWGRAGADGGAR